jgi:hypothetical protein
MTRNAYVVVVLVCLAAFAATLTRARDRAPVPVGLAKALLAPGPDETLKAKLDLFGQFVGNWEVAVVSHLPDGSSQTATGEWHFGWILDGRAIEDVWMVPRRAARQAGAAPIGYGTTLRFYDPKADAWQVLWASASSRTTIVFKARRVGDEIVMEAQDAPQPTRWIFSRITSESFHWRAVQSNDDWKTVETQQEMQARRIDSAGRLADALFAPGAARGHEAENHTFGQLVGDWAIAYEGFKPDGTIVETEGTLNVGWILDGLAVQDVWRFKDPQSGKWAGGTTIRLYDPKLAAWHSIWFYPVAGLIQQFEAREHDGEIVLDETAAAKPSERWTFSKIKENSFDWRAAESADNGRTWRITEHMRIERVPAPGVVAEPSSSSAQPELVAPGILSTGDFESHIEFSPDGGTAYFLRSLPNFAFWTIYESRLADGRWTHPEIAPFSGHYNDADPFITRDGRSLFFISNRPLHESSGPAKADTDIWVMDRQSNGSWGSPRNLGQPVNSSGNEFYPRAADDGTLYFGSDRPGGTGGVDIWRCRRDRNGRYLAAENLGAAVNSTSDEYEAYVPPDGSFMIVASTRPGGLGQSDFYVSYFRDGKWTAAKNLGAPANSAGKEYGGKISSDGRYFLFSSTRTTVTDSLPRRMTTAEYEALLHAPGNGLGDIYRLPVDALGLDADAANVVHRFR